MEDEISLKLLLKDAVTCIKDASYQQRYNELKEAVNNLIQTDFDKLVQILYRIDINEKALRKTLEHNKGTDAADIITKLLINRELEKATTRNGFKNNASDIPDDERW